MRLVAVAFASVLLVSCGSSRTPLLAPTTSSVAWVPQFLGFPADVVFTVHPTMVRQDPYWGPAANRTLYSVATDRKADAFLQWTAAEVGAARQADFYLTFRDPMRILGNGGGKDKLSAQTVGWVCVVYGAPPSDPMQIRLPSGESLYLPMTRLPSGVMMWNPVQKEVQSSNGLIPSLFVTPDGTWIATDQYSAPHVRDLLVGTPAAPPPLTAAGDVLAGAYSDFRTLGYVRSTRQDPILSLLGNATRGSISARAGTGSLETFVEYASSDDASRAYDTMISTCSQDPNRCAVDPQYFREVRPERDGKDVFVTMFFSNAVLRSIQSYSP